MQKYELLIIKTKTEKTNDLEYCYMKPQNSAKQKEWQKKALGGALMPCLFFLNDKLKLRISRKYIFTGLLYINLLFGTNSQIIFIYAGKKFQSPWL